MKDKTTFRPLADQVLILRADPVGETAGGILIPETYKDKPLEGEVIAVGPGKCTAEGRVIEPRVKKGDHVLFKEWADKQVQLDGEEYLIVRESDILGIFDS